MGENDIRTALERHWAASEASDFETEHDIYHEDAVLDYPQSGERIRGREGIRATRSLHPADRHFTVRGRRDGRGRRDPRRRRDGPRRAAESRPDGIHGVQSRVAGRR